VCDASTVSVEARDALELCKNEAGPDPVTPATTDIPAATATWRGQDSKDPYTIPKNRVYICDFFGQPGSSSSGTKVFIIKNGVLSVAHKAVPATLLNDLRTVFDTDKFIWVLDIKQNLIISPTWQLKEGAPAGSKPDEKNVATTREVKHGDLTPGLTPAERAAVSPTPLVVGGELKETRYTGPFRGIAAAAGELMFSTGDGASPQPKWMLNNKSGYGLGRITLAKARELMAARPTPTQWAGIKKQLPKDQVTSMSRESLHRVACAFHKLGVPVRVTKATVQDGVVSPPEGAVECPAEGPASPATATPTAPTPSPTAGAAPGALTPPGSPTKGSARQHVEVQYWLPKPDKV